MIKQFSDFKAERPAAARETLPAGGYVGKILSVEEQAYSWGSVLLFSFDIIEGRYKNFFADDYKANTRENKKWRGTYRLNLPKDDGSEKDQWNKRTFGNAIWAFEESNPGFTWGWDEQALKGKLVGLLFRNKEWSMNGRKGWTTECCALTNIEDIREGNFRTPLDKPLNNSGGTFTTLSPSPSDT